MTTVGRAHMAAQKPRTGDGPLEGTEEGRSMVRRLPVEGGGRLEIEPSKDEATGLHDTLAETLGPRADGAPYGPATAERQHRPRPETGERTLAAAYTDRRARHRA